LTITFHLDKKPDYAKIAWGEIMDDFEEYKVQGEPDKAEKAEIWEVAIGLQQVDGLKPSAYLIELAKSHIEGEITIDEVKERLNEYYKVKPSPETAESRTEEADQVSANITKILQEATFSFSPAGFIAIHKRLFHDVFRHAGRVRDFNITKKEWVLGGDTVQYAAAEEIQVTLDYDFAQERAFNYKGLFQSLTIKHIAKFTSGIWQIHPFGEGNTRATAIFLIKYLRKLGFEAENVYFKDNSWYFRNALVRANYNNRKKGIFETDEYLCRFLGNLLLGEKNVLNNRELYVGDSEI